MWRLPAPVTGARSPHMLFPFCYPQVPVPAHYTPMAAPPPAPQSPDLAAGRADDFVASGARGAAAPAASAAPAAAPALAGAQAQKPGQKPAPTPGHKPGQKRGKPKAPLNPKDQRRHPDGAPPLAHPELPPLPCAAPPSGSMPTATRASVPEWVYVYVLLLWALRKPSQASREDPPARADAAAAPVGRCPVSL